MIQLHFPFEVGLRIIQAEILDDLFHLTFFLELLLSDLLYTLVYTFGSLYF